ncbi:aquaporin [Apilactobacillus xinyiensis]|uniref:Aquaporin n=1 Tax=Apilactobacillus xinyiensis TaxID=2841032 RepID=A0ABT0I0Q9_9LACO|nr:aquaporin [Apilactobacillus xinyiensis]MCK8624421.1 aquaporin [Apilactobacillus xinyiensis]MCL0318712.1 aquaporin [Apilactobacillus xinyiensis]
MIIGELVGTYLMLGLGLVSSIFINYNLYPKPQNRLLTGAYWGLSIFIASIISTAIFGTANFNPIFSFLQAFNHQISWLTMLGEVLTQILGAWLASATVQKLWSKYLNTMPVNLNFFATVPRHLNKWLNNFTWEAIGTFTIVINSQIMDDVRLAWWIKTIWSSILITAVITTVAPITGAALNPTRDIVPRLFFTKTYDKKMAQWEYSIIPIAGPIVGGIIGLIVASFL